MDDIFTQNNHTLKKKQTEKDVNNEKIWEINPAISVDD